MLSCLIIGADNLLHGNMTTFLVKAIGRIEVTSERSSSQRLVSSTHNWMRLCVLPHSWSMELWLLSRRYRDIHQTQRSLGQRNPEGIYTVYKLGAPLCSLTMSFRLFSSPSTHPSKPVLMLQLDSNAITSHSHQFKDSICTREKRSG